MPSNAALKFVLNALYFSGAPMIGGRWARGMGSILMLHHVCEENKHPFNPNGGLTITPRFLTQLLENLTRKKFDFITMDEVAVRLNNPASAKSGNPFLSITLDDGYRDNLEVAAPIFRQFGVPYTVYVATGLVDGKAQLWWEDLERVIAARDTLYVDLDKGRQEIDTSSTVKKQQAFSNLMKLLTTVVDEDRQREIVSNLAVLYKTDAERHRAAQMMNWVEITELNSDPLCTIGAHTIHHPMLARLDRQRAMFEMTEGARVLEAELGERPKHFAYPYGMPTAAGPREFQLARECGFSTAVTTRHVVVHSRHSQHMTALPRISVNGGFQANRYVKTLISGLPTLLENRGTGINVS